MPSAERMTTEAEPECAEQTALEGLAGATQPSIPGLPRPVQPPLMALIDEEMPHTAPDVIPGQLTFGPQQSVLADAEPLPIQLSLLADPAIWEADRPSDGPKRFEGRLGRRRSRAGIGPGQTSLF